MKLWRTNPSSGQTIKRFVRFGVVGATGVVVDMGVLYFLADPRMLGWGLSVSKTLAAETAIINNFIGLCSPLLWFFCQIFTFR